MLANNISRNYASVIISVPYHNFVNIKCDVKKKVQNMQILIKNTNFKTHKVFNVRQKKKKKMPKRKVIV